MIIFNTNKGAIEFELDFEGAPDTCLNFLKYASEGFYDSTLFHRVVKGFVIQGGGLDESMVEKLTRDPIQNEAKADLKNMRGTVAMARTGEPHSATSQFFVNLKDNDFLNFRDETPSGWGYCVFAKVTRGMDVVDAIAAVDVGQHRAYQDVPTEPVIVESVTIDEAQLPEAMRDNIFED